MPSWLEKLLKPTLLIWFLAIGGQAATGAAQDHRVALVIGNASYTHATHAPVAARDARDIAAMLKRIGFSVTLALDVKREQFNRLLVAFGDQAENSRVALVYFSGYGMGIYDTNWLQPVDARLKTETKLLFESIDARYLQVAVRDARQLGLVILDASRPNPFLKTMRGAPQIRGLRPRGLAEPGGLKKNRVVALASAANTLAFDGDQGENSPFAAALLRHLPVQGVDIRLLFSRIRETVESATNYEQRPVLFGTLDGGLHSLVPAE